jgi:hypothetical protein
MSKTNTECDTYLSTLDGTFLALFSSATDASGGGTEITNNGMSRQAITFGAPTAAGGGGRQRVNSATIVFGPFSGSVAPTHYGIMSAITGGTMRRFGALTQAQTTSSGRLEIPAGDLVVKET